jgi:ribonuclease-3
MELPDLGAPASRRSEASASGRQSSDPIFKGINTEGPVNLPFKETGLLHQALVHRSYLNENLGVPLLSNERLEFMGDAVLGFLVTEELYRRFPHMSEGELTRLRASLVRGSTLARWGKRLGLGNALLLSQGEETSGGRHRPANLANVMEAVLGALFLDQGVEVVRTVVLPLLEEELASHGPQGLEKDPKSGFQELAQSRWQLTPTYRTITSEGPDHRRIFTVEALIGERVLGLGQGTSKQRAQQAAAQAALEALPAEDGAVSP